MRCEIIKDLLPLYCDDVLSEVSKEEVKKHLTECDDCKNAYEEMKKGDIKIDKAQKDIEPMKKVKKKIRFTKVFFAALVSAFILLTIAYELLCANPMLPSSKNVSYESSISYTFDIYRYFDDVEVKSKEISVPKDYDFKIDTFNNAVYMNGEILLDENGDKVPATGELFPAGNIRFYIYVDTKLTCVKRIVSQDIKDKKVSATVELRPCLPFRQDVSNLSEEHGFVLMEPLFAAEGSTLTIRCRDKDIIIDLYKLAQENK